MIAASLSSVLFSAKRARKYYLNEFASGQRDTKGVPDAIIVYQNALICTAGINGDTSGAQSAVEAVTVYTPGSMLLKEGSSGADVKALQEMLNQRGAALEVDGRFGSKTEAAVGLSRRRPELNRTTSTVTRPMPLGWLLWWRTTRGSRP